MGQGKEVGDSHKLKTMVKKDIFSTLSYGKELQFHNGIGQVSKLVLFIRQFRVQSRWVRPRAAAGGPDAGHVRSTPTGHPAVARPIIQETRPVQESAVKAERVADASGQWTSVSGAT